MSDARAKLAAALTKYQDAVAAAGKAKETLEKASSFVADLESQVEKFKALDNKIAAERAASIERALSAGEAPSLKASPELSAELIRKHDAENNLSAARQAVDVLEEKSKAADAAAKRTELEKEWAAAEVLASEAEELATAFAAEFEDLRRRYFVLQSMTEQRVRTDPSTLPASLPGSLIPSTTHIDFHRDVTTIMQLSSVIGSYEVNSKEQQVRDRSARTVKNFFARLQTDASAMIEDSPL